MNNPAFYPAGSAALPKAFYTEDSSALSEVFHTADSAALLTAAGSARRRADMLSIAVAARSPRVAILGYYGYGNLGDEISLGAIVSALRDSGTTDITVIGRRPYSGILPDGVRLADGRSPLALLPAIAHCDTLIAGGGTLLQNATGEKSLIYYTTLMRLAAAMGKEVKLYGGVGPVTGKAARDRAAAALRSCSTVCVRDGGSANAVKELCGIDAARADDPIFFTDYLRNSATDSHRGEYVAVQIRKTANSQHYVSDCEGAGTALRAAEMCRELRERHGARPVFVSMQDSYDLELCRLSASLCGGEVASPATGEELFSILSGARAAVGMRLHFLLAAVMSGVPAVALSYDPKVDSAARMFGLPIFPVRDLSPVKVCDALQSLA